MAIGKALAVSFGALAGGAAGFYVLEMYKIKSKVRNRVISFIFLETSATLTQLKHRRRD